MKVPIWFRADLKIFLQYYHLVQKISSKTIYTPNPKIIAVVLLLITNPKDQLTENIWVFGHLCALRRITIFEFVVIITVPHVVKSAVSHVLAFWMCIPRCKSTGSSCVATLPPTPIATVCIYVLATCCNQHSHQWWQCNQHFSTRIQTFSYIDQVKKWTFLWKKCRIH